MSGVSAPWGDQIVASPIGDVTFRMYAQRPRRVESLLAQAVRWGARAHIVQEGRVLGFDGLVRAVGAKVEHLRQRGVGRGARVFLLGWNSPEWIVNYWACLAAGATPVLANGWWSRAELAEGLARLQPVLTFADESGLARMPAGAPVGGWAIDPAAVGPSPPTVTDGLPDTANGGGEEDIATIIFTSGTEGRPKAVMLSHRALLAGLHMLLHVTRRLPQNVTEKDGDVALHTGPLFHIGGVQTLLRAVVVGSTLVFPGGKFDPGEAMALIERHRISRWTAVPTMVSRLLDHPDVKTRDLTSLRSLTVGGAPVHTELLRRIRDGLPSVQARIPTGYGLTENGGQASAAADSAEGPGSAGRPLPCVELRILPRAGLTDGEILVRSPTQMSGYYDSAQSPVDAEGWLHTGDLGRIDAKGMLWITGRCKDMIIRGGENIAPVAVEVALMTIPGVVEAAVVGVPHPDLGEEVMAVVVTDRALTAEQLQAALRDKVASFAVPSRWSIQTEPLPTNPAGKVEKPVLMARLREQGMLA